jgi:site-specific DNA-methyltransferase (adenine-specific)
VFLASLQTESVDLVVTDPPYEFARGKKYFRDWFAADLSDEEWTAVLAEVYRVLRCNRHAYVLCDRRTHRVFAGAVHQAGFRVHDPLIRDKDWLGLGRGAWRSKYELILFLEKGHRAGNRRNLGNVLRVRRPHRGYPTEKPVALLRTLLDQASAPGELMLDPFCRSGNVVVAARELGRRALLCDIAPAFAARKITSRPGIPGAHGDVTQ